ncbi:MAG: 50S ribosomal protein L1 [Rhodanobacteraceae bacterium]
MAHISKRFKAMNAAVEPGKPYPVDAALKILKDNAKTKFVESVDVAIRLGIDAKKSDQGVRGSTVLPHGTGKTVRVAVFCPAGEKAEAAKAAGADVVGMDELATQMQGGDIDFGVVIATPDAMRVVGKLGQLLGPRGLMPNPKVGTVTPDVVGAVKNAKAGQVRYRNDKAGIVHCSIGKVNFEIDALKDNLNALVADLIKGKPSTAKGQYLQKVSVSSTMGLGVIVDPSTLAATAAK